MEEWRVIEDYPQYEVSSYGNVRRVAPYKPRDPNKRHRKNTKQLPYLLEPWTHSTGYLVVDLTGKKQERVHRLVCRAFHGTPPSPKHEVAHNDGDRSNNHASNLRWDTTSGNALDRWKHGTIKATGAKLTQETAKIVFDLHHLGWSYKAIASRVGVHSTTVSRLIKGESWRKTRDLLKRP